MPRNKILSKLVLLPISKVFGLVVAVRNMLFDRGWFLKQTEIDIPTIVVGNIAVGGTGKTPHAEYIIRLLREYYNMGVISRGYKRNTEGFVLATPRTSPDDIGDEPFQMYHKFGSDAMIAVCEKRVEGIAKMREIDPNLNLIVLDDAFQHRYIKPKVSVVLIDYSRPPNADHMLPFGRLREPKHALSRADIVVVTKCSPNMRPLDFSLFKDGLKLLPWQKLFFSRYVYGHLVALFPEQADYIPRLEWMTEMDTILVVSGIANPRPFVRHLRRYNAKIKVLCYPDHHRFEHGDIEAITKKFESMPGEHRYIITTEKDAVRLSHNPYFPHELKSAIFYLPVSVEFIEPSTQMDVSARFDTTLRELVDRAPLG